MSWLPLAGFRLRRSGRLVASGSSELGAAQSVHSVPSLTAARLGLWPSGLAIASLPLVSHPWTGLCWSHLMSLSSVSDRFVVLPRQLVGSGVCSPASTICPRVLKQRSFRFSASISLRVFVFRVGFCLSPRSERKLFLHLPGVLVGAFAMRSPLRAEYFLDLDRNVDSSRTFPRVWCRAFAMGSPVSGRVAYFCALDWNEGLFHPSILHCFAMGSPYGSSVVFPPTRSERSLLWIAGRYSFRMGSPFSGQVLAI